MKTASRLGRQSSSKRKNRGAYALRRRTGQIGDVEARFIFQKSLYPDVDPTEIPLEDPVAKQVGKKFEFSSDQIKLTIKTSKRAKKCPVKGEVCYQASLGKIDIDEVGDETSKELIKAKWSCAPRSN